MCIATLHAKSFTSRHPLLEIMASVEKIQASIERLKKYNFDNRSYAIMLYDHGKIAISHTQDERGRFIVAIIRDNRLISVFPTQRMDAQHLRVDVIIQ